MVAVTMASTLPLTELHRWNAGSADEVFLGWCEEHNSSALSDVYRRGEDDNREQHTHERATKQEELCQSILRNDES